MQNVYTLAVLKINNKHSLQEITEKCLSAWDFNFFPNFYCGLCICESKHYLRLEVVNNLQKNESNFQGSKNYNKKKRQLYNLLYCSSIIFI